MGIFWRIVFLSVLLVCFLSAGCSESSSDSGDLHTLNLSPISNETVKPSAGNVSMMKTTLDYLHTYANSYRSYTRADLEKLKKFDIVMVEPYEMPASYIAELKKAGTVVIAYISIGEADESRRYWRTWEPTDIAWDIPDIPRTTIDIHDPMFIEPDPEWPGSYFVDASDETWQTIMVNEEIPYILALGGGQYDGIVMDVIDVVDEYEGLPREKEMRQGMVTLISKIREKYPHLLLIPNRGFGIADEIASYIDGFKFEELSFGFSGDEERYVSQLDSTGNHTNQDEIDLAVAIGRNYQIPLFVLDHVETNPMDTASALHGYKEAQRLSELNGVRFLWYANSVDQDLPIWEFLFES